MSKMIIIGKSNELYLEVLETDKNGNQYRKRTCKEEEIHSYLKKHADKFMDGVFKGKNLILYTAEGNSIIIKDYESRMQEPIFSTLFRRIAQAPIVSENLENNKRSTIFDCLKLKLLYANKAKIATLALTGMVLISTVPVMTTGIINLHHKQDLTVVLEEVTKEIVTEEMSLAKEEPVPVVEEVDILDFAFRLEETKILQADYNEYDRSKMMLGARININTIEEIYESQKGKIIKEVALTYGIDPYLLLSKGLCESNLQHEACCPGGKRYNGYGVGAFQLESPDGRIVKAWNYKTETEDTLAITMENAIDFRTNTQAAAMYLQNRINFYHGNIYLALQSYNYGQGMMKIVIHDYAKQLGITEEEVKKNYTDLGWLNIVEDIHKNPNDYYYRVTIDLDETDPQIINEAQKKYVWKYDTYGNPYYIADVLSYYVGLQTQNRNLDGTSTIMNFLTNEIKIVSDEETIVKQF